MTEFTSADGVLRAKGQKAKRYLHFYPDEHSDFCAAFRQQSASDAESGRAWSKGWGSI